ncbi:MAG: NADH-quinone oxidoreductase subunit A [Anaerolineaceae bacterium]
MIQDYLPLVILITVATGLGFIALTIGLIFGPRRPTKRKGLPYESGMTPYGPGIRRMNVRYYLVAVLFILFDVEIIFFLPWALVFKSLGIFGLIEMILFTVIVLIGFVYAWAKGALEWE